MKLGELKLHSSSDNEIDSSIQETHLEGLVGRLDQRIYDLAQSVATVVRKVDETAQLQQIKAERVDTLAQSVGSVVQKVDEMAQQQQLTAQRVDTLAQSVPSVEQKVEEIGQQQQTTTQKIDTLKQSIDESIETKLEKFESRITRKLDDQALARDRTMKAHFDGIHRSSIILGVAFSFVAGISFLVTRSQRLE